GIAEPDDVRAAIPGHIGQEPRMPVHPPAAGVEPEDTEYHPGRLERAVAVAQCRPYPGVAEADDVRPVMSGQVGQYPQIPLDRPAYGVRPDRDGRHGVPADRTRYPELAAVRLRRPELRPGPATVLRLPQVAGKRPG